MQKLAKQLMSLFTLTILVFGWGGWAILKNIFPNEQFSWYLYIPIMFFLMGNLLIIILAKNYKLEAKKLVNLYMVIKLVKLVTAMIYILAFYFIIKDDLRAFGLVFAAFYAIYIACEFYIFYSIEKQIKKEA
ncbi:MAG: hypothetical protein ACOYMD_13705 [Paludibacter sp.]